MEERILILDTESPSSLPFIAYYHSLNFRVFAGSPHRFPISLFSKIPVVKYRYPSTGYLIDYGSGPLINRKQMEIFISSLKKFIEKNQIEYVIALQEGTLIPISLNIKKLGIRNIYPSYTVIKSLHDKFLLYKNLGKIHIRSFFLPSIFSLKNISFPCIVRPTKGTGSFYTFVCKNLKEVKKAIAILKTRGRKPLIQKYVSSRRKFVFNLLVNKKGKIVRLLSSIKIEKNKIKRIVKELELFFKRIGYFGFASPQFILSEEGIYLVEINPRLSYYHYGLDFGANFPEGFHKLFVEGKKSIRKKFVFMELPSLLQASKMYLKETGEFLVVVKNLEACVKSIFIRCFQRSFRKLSM